MVPYALDIVEADNAIENLAGEYSLNEDTSDMNVMDYNLDSKYGSISRYTLKERYVQMAKLLVPFSFRRENAPLDPEIMRDCLTSDSMIVADTIAQSQRHFKVFEELHTIEGQVDAQIKELKKVKVSLATAANQVCDDSQKLITTVNDIVLLHYSYW